MFEEKEKIAALQVEWNKLFITAQVIAALPLEKWLADLEKAEAIAPIVDPTLARSYMSSGKGEVLKNVIRAALPLKKAINDARQQVLEGKVK